MQKKRFSVSIDDGEESPSRSRKRHVPSPTIAATSKGPLAGPFNDCVQKYAFHKLVKHLISRPNIASCYSVTPSYFDYDKEFEKFLDFVEGIEEPGKSQLTNAIFPLFVNFYLSLVPEINEAETFYHKFVDIFSSAKDYTDVLKELYEVKSKKNMEEHPYFKNFRVRKYILRISCAVLNELNSFLKGIESKALWQILCLFFYFEDPDLESFTSDIFKKQTEVKETERAKRRDEVDELERMEHYLFFSAKRDNKAQDTSVENKPNILQSPEDDNSTSSQTIDLTNDNPLFIRTVFNWSESGIYTMDFDQPETEICVTFGRSYIYVSPLEEKKIVDQFKRPTDPKETNESDDDKKSDRDSDDEEESDRDSDEDESDSDSDDDFNFRRPHRNKDSDKDDDDKDKMGKVKDSLVEKKQDFEYKKGPAVPEVNKPANEGQGSARKSVPDVTINPVKIPWKINRGSGMANLSEASWDKLEKEDLKARWIDFPAPVYVAKYFPNLPHLLLVASGTEIIATDTASLNKKSLGSGHAGQIWDIDINSTGSLFCTASDDMTCRLWDYSESTVVRIYRGHKETVNTVKFHPNGIYILSGSRDNDVRLWNIENSICLRCFVGHKAAVITVACSPNKKTIASADADGIVKLWNIEDNSRILDLQCYNRDSDENCKITAICFADEHFLGLCNSSSEIQIWDIRQPVKVYSKIESELIPVLMKGICFGKWSVVLHKRG